MKLDDSAKQFPVNTEQWEAIIACASGEDRSLTIEEEKQWNGAVIIKSGGYQAVKAALAAKRKPGQRGEQSSPTKKLVSVRYSPEVIAYFKSGGDGWQTRMDDALKQWIAANGHQSNLS